MCASAARQATGERSFAQTYAHAGMMAYQGEKMSKSLGNLVLASQLRADGADANDVRLALLAGHYRDDREWTAALLADATERRRRWADEALTRQPASGRTEETPQTPGSTVATMVDALLGITLR